MFRIIQIAENNSRLSDEFKSKYTEIPWMAIKGMRNKIVHNYGVVNMAIVYDTVTRGIPEMYEKLIKIQWDIMGSRCSRILLGTTSVFECKKVLWRQRTT